MEYFRISPVDLKHFCVEVPETDEQVKEKTPILLIHGLGGSYKEWDGLSLLLSQRTKRRVCSVDLRNHGDSPWSKRTDVKAMAVDIGHFLDTQGMEKVNIIGHSFGGKVAVHYTLTNPSRVNSIVVEDWRPNGVVKEAYDKVITFYDVLNDGLSTVPLGVTEDDARQILVNSLNKNKEKIGVNREFTKDSLYFLLLKLVDGKWLFKHNMNVLLKAMKNTDTFLGESTGIYKGPALFIYGEKSSFKIAEDRDNILNLFPRAKLVKVEGAGHIIHGDFRQFDEEVVKFLNEAN